MLDKNAKHEPQWGVGGGASCSLDPGLRSTQLANQMGQENKKKMAVFVLCVLSSLLHSALHDTGTVVLQASLMTIPTDAAHTSYTSAPAYAQWCTESFRLLR